MGEIEEKAKALNIKGAIATLIISSFGFVAALSCSFAARACAAISHADAQDSGGMQSRS